jgi:hypothetical protein
MRVRMKIYWNNKHRKAEILEDIEKDNAQPWDDTEPNSRIIIGTNRIFIGPPDYDIDGYSLSINDLEELIQKIKTKALEIPKQMYRIISYSNLRSEERTTDDLKIGPMGEILWAETDEQIKRIVREKYGSSQDVEIYAPGGIKLEF